MKDGALQIRFCLRARLGDATPAADTGRLPKVTLALALAIHFEDLIQTGEAKDYAGVARIHCLSRERVSQIVRLLYLAPEIQIELLYLPPTPTGRFPISETAVRKVASLLSWADQRSQWGRIKTAAGVAPPSA